MGDKSSSSEVSPWKDTVPYLSDIMSAGEGLYGSTTSAKEYQGLGIEQQNNIQNLLNYYSSSGGNQGYIDQNNAGMSKLLGATDDWTNNAALQAGMDANALASQRQLTEVALPGIRSGAEGAGQYGSSRQGIAEGIAMRGANENLTSANASLMNNYYNQAVGQEALGMSLLPQSQTIGQSNLAGTMSAQDMLDTNNNAAYEQNWYNQNQAQWDQLGNYQNAINPYTGIGSTTTTSGGEPSTMGKVAGAAATGLGAYGTMAAIPALAGTGVGAPVAAGLALASLFG